MLADQLLRVVAQLLRVSIKSNSPTIKSKCSVWKSGPQRAIQMHEKGFRYRLYWCPRKLLFVGMIP
jgi:hypothetical protein